MLWKKPLLQRLNVGAAQNYDFASCSFSLHSRTCVAGVAEAAVAASNSSPQPPLLLGSSSSSSPPPSSSSPPPPPPPPPPRSSFFLLSTQQLVDPFENPVHRHYRKKLWIVTIPSPVNSLFKFTFFFCQTTSESQCHNIASRHNFTKSSIHSS
jgi:hypothetical protein